MLGGDNVERGDRVFAPALLACPGGAKCSE